MYKIHFSLNVKQQHLNFQYRTVSFSTIWLNVQPPLQYPPLISFFTSATFHPTISFSHVFSKPSLQSLPILACSMSDIFWNSLLAHTAIPTVPIKNPFPYHWYSANSNCAKGPIIERILRRITLFQSFPISLKHGQGSQLSNSSRLHFNFGFFILYSSPLSRA